MCTNRPSLPLKNGISRNIVGVAEAVPKDLKRLVS